MCTIMATTGTAVTLPEFREAFGRTKYRGPDDTRIESSEYGIMGFHRLSIMGLTPEGMQPFELNGYKVICNGEIYGFEIIRASLEKKGYSFKSDSDCELLLPLWLEHGTDMFGMLDAEYACVIFNSDTGEYVAARDPIGIRPLYYGFDREGKIAFASEPKSLLGICEDIRPFPPGHYWKNGEFIEYRDMTDVRGYVSGDLDEICGNIRDKLTEGVRKRLVADVKVGFLLSGGLDSSLVCAIAARESDTPIRTFAVGMDLDPIDLKYAKTAAEYMGSDHTEVIISKQDVLDSLENVIWVLGTYDITTIRASIGMYLMCKAIHEQTDIRVILTGEISDELFGYKYTDFAPSAEAFQQEACKRVKELHMYDVLRADRCISSNSLEGRVPFGDLDLVSYVMSIDPEIKLNKYGKGKYLLRKAFEGDYLPDEILWREKAAFSDAVGHSLVDDLKELAETQYTDEEFETKRKQYKHATPFTKESLLYREIFEKFYPGQAEMIVDFWKPNKSWEGCDVDDPSARVLSNYGDSGK